eukprot:scaffold916_cov516-Prasinococcus_capsulatus_cf.AAC.16
MAFPQAQAPVSLTVGASTPSQRRWALAGHSGSLRPTYCVVDDASPVAVFVLDPVGVPLAQVPQQRLVLSAHRQLQAGSKGKSDQSLPPQTITRAAAASTTATYHVQGALALHGGQRLPLAVKLIQAEVQHFAVVYLRLRGTACPGQQRGRFAAACSASWRETRTA